MANCKDCKWYDIDPGDNTDGRCHRFPPNQESMTSIEFFRAVNEDDWCGEFKPKAAEPLETSDADAEGVLPQS